MRSLLLFVVGIACIQTLMVVANKDYQTIQLNVVDQKNGTVTPMFMVSKKSTNCFYKFKGTHLYSFGYPRQAKTTFKITVTGQGTFYSIDSSKGLDFAMKIVPITEDTFVTGHILKCDISSCPNKEYKADIDYLFISICSGQKWAVDGKCSNIPSCFDAVEEDEYYP